jgi:hypothetical protein
VTDARPRPRWVRTLGALLGGASVLALLAGPAGLDGLRAAGTGEREPVVCSFRASTGLPCLGCGGTRALERMAQGDWRSALAANPLGAFTGLALWLLAAAGAWAALSARARPLGLVFGMLVALAPGAFVWNLVWWWQSLPPGGPMR